jgi:hypothetical protein
MTRCLCLSVVLFLFAAPTSAEPPATEPARREDVDLLDRVIPDLRLENVTLEDAIGAIRESSRANIVIRWDGLEKAGIDKTKKIKLHLWDIPVREAVTTVLVCAGGMLSDIDYSLEGTVFVVSEKSSQGPAYDVRVFDVHDLLEAAIARRMKADSASAATGGGPPGKTPTEIEEEEAQKLVELITEMADDSVWHNTGGDGKMRIWSGRLFVSKTPLVQNRVGTFLEKIRQSQPKP